MNKQYDRIKDFWDIFDMWYELLAEAPYMAYENNMPEDMIELFHKAMLRAFNYLKLNQPKDMNSYTYEDMVLYGLICSYANFFGAAVPLKDMYKEYFFAASLDAADILSSCFFNRELLKNTVVCCTYSLYSSDKEKEGHASYDFAKGDLSSIAKMLKQGYIRQY